MMPKITANREPKAERQKRNMKAHQVIARAAVEAGEASLARIKEKISVGEGRSKIDQPYVTADSNRYIAIVLHTARKYIYAVTYNHGIRIIRKNREAFESVYQPLLAAGIPYSVQVAARKYLDWGKRAGITEVAERALQNILKGDYDMSDVEGKTANQGDPKVPSNGTLGAALTEAGKPAPKASTKNGTTKSAKKPSRAKTTTTTQPKESAVSKTATKKKPATKKPAAKKPAAKPAKAAPKKATNGSGRVSKVKDDSKFTFVAENPKRKGTAAWDKFAKYKVGMTVGAVIAKGVDRADVNYNLSRKFVKIG